MLFRAMFGGAAPPVLASLSLTSKGLRPLWSTILCFVLPPPDYDDDIRLMNFLETWEIDFLPLLSNLISNPIVDTSPRELMSKPAFLRSTYLL